MATPSPAKSDSAISLDDVERVGAVRMGRRVHRVAIYYEDGGRAVLDMPPSLLSDDPELTPMQAAVLEVIEEMKVGDVLSFEDIAEKSGYANSGKLRAFVKSVAATFHLSRVARGWKKTA